MPNRIGPEEEANPVLKTRLSPTAKHKVISPKRWKLAICTQPSSDRLKVLMVVRQAS